MTSKQSTTVFYVNLNCARGCDIEEFFYSDAGNAFWRDLFAAAAKYAPEICTAKPTKKLDTICLPSEAADAFIDRLNEIHEQNWTCGHYTDEETALTEDEQPIQFYETNRPNAFKEWAADLDY